MNELVQTQLEIGYCAPHTNILNIVECHAMNELMP